MTVSNLIINSGFETGTLEGWTARNVSVTTVSPHTGRYSAFFPSGSTNSFLEQTVSIEPGQNFQLLVSLSKSGALPNPELNLSVTFLNEANTEVGFGLSTEVTSGTLPSVLLNDWHEVYQVTGTAPVNATQARIQITQMNNRWYYSGILVDDVHLLSFGDGTGATGATGPFITF